MSKKNKKYEARDYRDLKYLRELLAGVGRLPPDRLPPKETFRLTILYFYMMDKIPALMACLALAGGSKFLYDRLDEFKDEVNEIVKEDAVEMNDDVEDLLKRMLEIGGGNKDANSN